MSEQFLYHRVLLDAGALVAMVHEDDSNHARCAETLRVIEPPLLTCWPVLTEAAWLLRQRHTAWEEIVEGVDRGLLSLPALDVKELAAISWLMARYRNLPLQLADAVLLHLADRDNLTTVFTLDRRDFSIVRLRNKGRLTLLPETQ